MPVDEEALEASAWIFAYSHALRELRYMDFQRQSAVDAMFRWATKLRDKLPQPLPEDLGEMIRRAGEPFDPEWIDNLAELNGSAMGSIKRFAGLGRG